LFGAQERSLLVTLISTETGKRSFRDSFGDLLIDVQCRTIKNWEIIADNLSKPGWSCGCVSAVDSRGRTIWIADAHRDDGRRFVVRADEKLSAFVELERQVLTVTFILNPFMPVTNQLVSWR
jgi:hypothetical protein